MARQTEDPGQGRAGEDGRRRKTVSGRGGAPAGELAQLRVELERSRAMIALLQETQRIDELDLTDEETGRRFLRLVRSLFSARRTALVHLTRSGEGFAALGQLTVPSWDLPPARLPDSATAEPLVVRGSPRDGEPAASVRALVPGRDELIWVPDEERATALLVCISDLPGRGRRDDDETGFRLRLAQQALQRYQDALARRRRLRVSTRSEDRLRHLLDGLSDAAYRADAAGTFAYINQAGQDLLGMPVERIIGSSFLDFIHPRDHEYAATMHGRTLAGESVQAEVTLVSGKVLECRNEPLYGADGRVTGLLGTARDVTVRRHAEEAYRALVENSLQGLVIFQDGGIVFANPAFERMVGYSRRELVEMSAGEMEALVHPEDRDMVWDRFRRRQQGEEVPRHYAFRMQHRAGSEVWVEMFASLVEYKGAPAVQAALVDVTDHRRREREQEAILRVATTVRSATTRREMMAAILDELTELLDAEGGVFVVRSDDAEGRDLRVELGRGVWAEATGGRLRSDASLTGRVMAAAESFLSNDIRSDPRFARPDMLDVTRAVMGAPLVAEAEVSGVLWVGRRDAFGDEELRLLSALAEFAAMALHRVTLVEQLQRSCRRLEEAWESTLAGWSRALELRDRQTEDHTRRVADVAVALGRRLDLPEEQLKALRRGALAHDLGKMGIPDEILLKQGPLDADEWRVMRQHPQMGRRLLEGVEELDSALDVVTFHHERWDGGGYPEGLRGDEIPLLARIFAVVDVWDALGSDRPYREAWPRQRIIDHLREQSGRHFEPRIVEAFLEMLGEG